MVSLMLTFLYTGILECCYTVYINNMIWLTFFFFFFSILVLVLGHSSLDSGLCCSSALSPPPLEALLDCVVVLNDLCYAN